MSGHRLKQHRLFALMGPAFIAAIAYVDPGNVAANITAGARYGYLLVWVLVLSNLSAMLVQYLSAKLGIVTGKSLPALLGERLRPHNRILFWVQAEVVAAATDLAEVIGGAIALNLLFGIPLLWSGVIIGAASIVILLFQGHRQNIFEAVIIGMLVVITAGFLAGLFFAPPQWSEVAGGLIPRFKGTDSILVAASMLGATVMPHAIYLHSSLVNDHHTDPEIERPHKRASSRNSSRYLVGTEHCWDRQYWPAPPCRLGFVWSRRNRHHRRRLPRDRKCPGRHCFHDLRSRPTCLRLGINFGGRLRGFRNHERSSPRERPTVGTPPGNDHPGPDHLGNGSRTNMGIGALAGRPFLRYPLRHCAAHVFDAKQEAHGRICE